MDKLIRSFDWDKYTHTFIHSGPFNHVCIDNFFLPEVADQLSKEFPKYDDPSLGFYNNAIENKKVYNRWDKFPPLTYQALTMLGREDFLFHVRGLVGNPNKHELWMDYGLNGGGWHMHTRGGKNNIHLDYNIHPKLGQQRKLNIIIYLTPDWDPQWGGGLELWSHDPITNGPGELVKTIENKFNRAVIFDTTQNSWHGLPTEISCPPGVIRKSLAAYYVRPAPANADPRGKVLFAPTEEQKNDPEIEKLIHERSRVDLAEKFYAGDK